MNTHKQQIQELEQIINEAQRKKEHLQNAKWHKEHWKQMGHNKQGAETCYQLESHQCKLYIEKYNQILGGF